MAVNEPSDQMLRRVAYSIARMYMEIERGLRSPEHLQPVLTKPAYLVFRRTTMPQRFPNAGPVLPTDIRGITVNRHVAGQATISMTTREEEDRWGAIVLHLRAPKGPGDSWKADQLERIRRHRRELARERETPEPVGLPERISRVEQERNLSEAAGRAVAARLKELKALPEEQQDRDEMKGLRQQRRRWSAKVKELDEEMLDLRRRHALRTRLGLGVETLNGHGPELSAEELGRVLGPKPPDDRRAALWQTAADGIQSYRTRWDVTDTQTALGASPEDAEQRRHRGQVAELLRTLAPQLRRDPAGERQLDGAATARDQREEGLSLEP